MINISNCPISGLKRKVNYNFFWYKLNQILMIDCYVYYFSVNDELITTIDPYKRILTAQGDSYSSYIEQFGGDKEINLETVIGEIIEQRDEEGVFN